MAEMHVCDLLDQMRNRDMRGRLCLVKLFYPTSALKKLLANQRGNFDSELLNQPFSAVP